MQQLQTWVHHAEPLIVARQVFEFLPNDTPKPSPDFRAIHVIVVNPAFIAGVVRRIDIDHFDFAQVRLLQELENFQVVTLDVEILGVNARNLADFAEDREGVAALASQIPAGVLAVAESAIRSLEDAAKMAGAGFNAVLVGEALVRHPDPSSLVSDMAGVLVSQR